MRALGQELRSGCARARPTAAPRPYRPHRGVTLRRPRGGDGEGRRLGRGGGPRGGLWEVEPGSCRTWFEGAVVRSSTVGVTVSGDAEAPDKVGVSVPLQLWRISGVTRLPDGV